MRSRSWSDIADGDFNLGSLNGRRISAGLNGGDGVEAWGANFNSDALLVGTETTVLVVGDADGLLL